MTTIINGSSPSVTFSDGSTQNTSAVVGTSVPYALLPTGSVLQVQSATFADTTTISSGSYIDTGVTVSITPKFSTSKILTLATIQCSGAANNYLKINLVRNSTTIAQPSNVSSQPSTSNSYIGDLGIATEVYNVSVNYLDSPSTTSATTYKIQARTDAGTGYINTRADGIGKQISTITVMEIAG